MCTAGHSYYRITCDLVTSGLNLFISEYRAPLQLKRISFVSNIHFSNFCLNFERALHRFSKKVQTGKMLCRDRNEDLSRTS